ncbi:MAG: type II toxin-antitoxin system HipA family toxin YjjJ [Pseudomonadota bacterium]
MRPKNLLARDRLAAVLARQPASSAAALAEAVGVSVPTLHRLLQELGGAVIVGGQARRARYALRRPLRGEPGELPLYRIDAQGRASDLTHLSLTQPQGTWMKLQGTPWPVPPESVDGWWAGLPYPLQDMRPQGYMGRQFARRAHRALSVSADPQAWTDEDTLFALSRQGLDATGDLVVGTPAFEAWQHDKLSPPAPLSKAACGPAYSALANEAVAAGVAGSSAAGEFPKFAALREGPGSATPHVLVKFSGADGSPTVQRWADLLVCEHLALGCAAELPGVRSAASRILVHAGRTFLEVERFDRHGLWGRSALCSLGVLNAEWLGLATSEWPALVGGLADAGLVDAAVVAGTQHLWWFGRLIANTDMHTGNLSFQIGTVPSDLAPGSNAFTLAPTYDMLPMGYAPLAGGEIPVRRFEAALPLPAQQPVWATACAAAMHFWDLAARDKRISPAFRTICRANQTHLQDVIQRL